MVFDNISGEPLGIAGGTTVSGALALKGGLDASSNPNYPAATIGDVYVVTVAGKVGGASGVTVSVQDQVIATATNAGGTQASVGSSWIVAEGNITIDTDSTMAANSDLVVPSQKAVKTALATKQATGTTVGQAFVNLTNPSAITFPRINADNSVTARSAANFLTDIGAASSGANSSITSLTGLTGRLQTTLTTQQMLLSYDGSNNLGVTVSSAGVATFAPSGGQSVFSGVIIGTYRSATFSGASNFEVTSGTSLFNFNDNLDGNVAQGRTAVNGNSSTISANQSYASMFFSNNSITEAASGTHPMICQLGIQPVVVTGGAGAVTRTATLFIVGPSTATVTDQNYALYVKSGPASFANVQVLSGSNAKAGTFTLTGGTVTHANTSVTANSVVIPTLKTLGGTRAGLPDIVCTAGVGFVATAVGTDTSTYNYVIVEVN